MDLRRELRGAVRRAGRGRGRLFGRRSGVIRRLGWIGIGSIAWSNRQDVTRWVGFAQRAVRERDGRPLADLLTEAKVRAAVTRDPLLRHDPALGDLRVDDGVVTLLTNTAGWPDPRDQIVRLKQVKGVTDVTTVPAPFDPVRSSRQMRSTFAPRCGPYATPAARSARSARSTASTATGVADARIDAPSTASTSGGR